MEYALNHIPKTRVSARAVWDPEVTNQGAEGCALLSCGLFHISGPGSRPPSQGCG